MKASRKLKRTQERRFSAHHMLIRAAAIALERGKKRQPGWMFDDLSAMTYSALAIEALCNSLGDLVIPDWETDFEMAPTAAKIRVLTKHLGIPYDKTKEPWSTAKDLGKFRNLVAHAKPQIIVEEQVMSQEDYDEKLFDVPKSKLEKQINSANAARAVEAVERIKDMFIEKLDAEQRFGFTSDGWSGSTKLHDG